MDAAKPCPFCGTTDKVEVYEVDVSITPRNLKIGHRCGCVNPECDINPYTRTIWSTPAEALESWNRRV